MNISKNILSKKSKPFFKSILFLVLYPELYGLLSAPANQKPSTKKLSILEGSVYTILTRLKNSGFVTDRQELVGAKLTRVYYSITDEGRQHLEEARNVLNEYIEVVKTVTAKQ